MRKLNVSDDAENDLSINKMVFIISHIDNFNEEVTVFDLFWIFIPLTLFEDLFSMFSPLS